MSLERITLQTLRSELRYQGAYANNAFELLGPPLPLYRSLVKHLGQFGASLQNLGIELSNLPNVHVTCNLSDLNAAIRVRIDRVEIDLLKAHEIGADIAHRIAMATWAAVSEADHLVEPASHTVEVSSVAEVRGTTCAALMGRYLVTPEALGVVDTGVAFYSRPVPVGQRWVNLILDRVFGQDGQVFVKVTTSFPAVEVGLDALADYVDKLVTATLDNVGLQFEARDQT